MSDAKITLETIASDEGLKRLNTALADGAQRAAQLQRELKNLERETQSGTTATAEQADAMKALRVELLEQKQANSEYAKAIKETVSSLGEVKQESGLLDSVMSQLSGQMGIGEQAFSSLTVAAGMFAASLATEVASALADFGRKIVELGLDAEHGVAQFDAMVNSTVGGVEAMQLFKEANRMLDRLDETISIHCIFRLCQANADGDNLLIEGTTFPLLRQQTPQPDGGPFLCLSDFVRPLSSGTPDIVGLFASTISEEAEETYKNDPYKHLLVQTLNDRLAEAATEKMHEYVRKEAWGYAPDESLSIPDLLVEKYQGIRPAVGYPSLPDQSVNFLLDELLGMKQIGITLTEHGAMHPHSSVCGMMLAHPASRYFAVGKIGEDQLDDYACRRGMPIGDMRKFLATTI